MCENTNRGCRRCRAAALLTIAAVTVVVSTAAPQAERLQRLSHHVSGLTTDLGVGLWGWPVPCDRNGDGRPDLLVSSAGVPDKGLYYFENTGRLDRATGAEIFAAPVRISTGRTNLTPSYTSEGLRVLGPGVEYPAFLERGLDVEIKLPVDPKSIRSPKGRIRADQWSYVDFDGDGRLDLVVGTGDWTDYGWDNAYDVHGRWTNGVLHGFVHVLRNEGTDTKPRYGVPVRLEADGRPVDVFGMPSPVFGDFRGTGKLDLICGEFVDGFTFFENTGSRTEPSYAPGKRLRCEGQYLTMPLEMIVVVAFDWNRDGRPDLVVGQEDGRVAWLRNTGRVVDGMPEFAPPLFFRQEADEVKFGALTTPMSVDWDGDGLVDLLAGNTAGEIGFIRNLGGVPVRWAEPVALEAGGQPLRILAGYNGSIQGPAESKWGYTKIGVGDWDGDGLIDVVANSIWGRIVWFRNIGTRSAPRLAAAEPVRAAWNGPVPKPAWNWWNPAPGELVLEWRCTPYVIDLDRDGIQDLVAPDHEGYLAWFRQVVRDGQRVVLPGQRVFRMRGLSEFDARQAPRQDGPKNGLLRMNFKTAGGSGRRMFCFSDWDGDGRLDLLVNSVNVNLLRNVGSGPDDWTFVDEGPLDGKRLAGHSTAPTTVDWDGNGIPDLLVGAEDGYFYFMRNPRAGD